jgi:hypothetical protein
VNDADITKLGWTRGVAEVHKAAFRQNDDLLAVREFHMVDLRLDSSHLKFFKPAT